MTINDKIRDETLHYDIEREKQKDQHYLQVKMINLNILKTQKYYLSIKSKPLSKLNFHIRI